MGERIVVIIPARMASTRYPGKPLASLLGRPMIEHVFRRVSMYIEATEVYVASCDQEIKEAAEGFGANVIMTSPEHERASDRAAEAAENLQADIIVMVQGDEPMITPEMVSAALDPMLYDRSITCTNLARRITSREQYLDPNTIKVVMDTNGDALYFSRCPIPAIDPANIDRADVYKQVCVISFRGAFLREYARLAPTPLERAESIDMLRIL